MVACVPCFGGYCHGCGCEVLHLFEVEVERFGDDGEFCHIGCGTARMTADEVGYELLAQVMALACIVEDALEVVEESEGWFAHDGEDCIGSMLGCHLEASADMTSDEFFGILTVDAVDALITCVVKQEVVTYATTYKTFLYGFNCIYCMVYVEQLTMVGVEILAY